MDSLNFQITHKDISLAESKDKLATKSKEIKALQSKLKTLEKNSSLAQMNLSEMDSLRLELEQAKDDLSSKEYELECLERGWRRKIMQLTLSIPNWPAGGFSFVITRVRYNQSLL